MRHKNYLYFLALVFVLLPKIFNLIRDRNFWKNYVFQSDFEIYNNIYAEEVLFLADKGSRVKMLKSGTWKKKANTRNYAFSWTRTFFQSEAKR